MAGADGEMEAACSCRDAALKFLSSVMISALSFMKPKASP
jgi:hypothetical protein